jgi:hypothetical protein
VIAANVGGSLTGTLAEGAVHYYSFHWPGGPFEVTTLGSTLAPENDTEIALWDATNGLFVASDDDGAGGTLSALAGILDPGDYLLGIGGFNTSWHYGFGATSTSTNTGAYVINGLNLVPEPGAVGLLSVTGFVIFWRRRRL